MKLAITAHTEGRLQDAERLYRYVLQNFPNYPDANHNLGVLKLSLNQAENSLSFFKAALAANPSQGQFWISYIDALIKTNELERARDMLLQGKKLGLTGEKLSALEMKLKSLSQKQALANQEIKQELTAAHPLKIGVSKKLKQHKKRSPSKSNIDLLLSHYQKGLYSNAENLSKKIIRDFPDHPFAWKVLGVLLQKTGRLQESLIPYGRALELSPDDASSHSNLGIALQELGRLKAAEASFVKAINLKADFVEAHYNLGITLHELGRLEDSKASYNQAIKLRPNLAEAHSNLGNLLKDLGRLEEAEACCKKAIKLKPNLAGTHSNLGTILKELGRLEEAEESYKQAIKLEPNFAEAYCNLGNLLKELGRLEEAFVVLIKSIKIKPTVEAKSFFIATSKGICIQAWNQSVAQLVITALLEPWGRPVDVMPFACRLLKTNNKFIQLLDKSKSSDTQSNYDIKLLSSITNKEFDGASLIGAMLTSSPIADDEIEAYLTLLRKFLLKEAESVTSMNKKIIELPEIYCFLAQQCFINEYIYFQTKDEINLSHQLRDRLTKAIESQQSIPAVWVVAVACYFPLYSVAGKEKLLNQKWSDDVKIVLQQQIKEPLMELSLRASIQVLTKIDDQVSLAVQNQYEKNPYPRWVHLPKATNKKFLNAYIQSKFPLSSFCQFVDDRNLEILITGCGTGQHPISTSQSFKGARILAVDLSTASLAYAKRKTIELGIEELEYAQADILKLASLARTFDLIESVGVLHHLENPFEGWKVLLSLLRPHGLMKIGFYSELARRDIVRVRNLIKKEGLGSAVQDIRDLRKNLLGLKYSGSEDYGFATRSFDFFSTSDCRDLLFHVQEYRLTLPVLANFLKENNLTFLGFEIDSIVKRSYINRFPDDLPAANLNNWHSYEQENPGTFSGMYQFWVQKNT